MIQKVRYVKLVPMCCAVISIMLIAALFCNRAATVIADSEALVGRKTVIIDAGHGLPDGGATSCSGVLESDLNLQIASRLNDLMHLLGMKTYMIRTTQDSVYTEGKTIAAKKISDLKNRVKIANSMPDAILVSIHQNFFSDSRYQGAQVFFADTEGSHDLAKVIQQGFRLWLDPENHRQCKPAQGVYLMNHIKTTGILIECGFVSNPQEEARLVSDAYQKKLVSAIACSIHNHINTIA